VDPHLQTPAGKPRARSLIEGFPGTPGRWNAITDVAGVEVGYTTLIEGTDVRTGVSAICPRGRDGSDDPCAAACVSLNGNGEMTGVSWIAESGTLALPVSITHTHAVGVAHEAVARWSAGHYPALRELWMLPVAAETFDGYLNDINGGRVRREDVIAAVESAASGPIEEGSVGGGTGMNCYAFKGGSGSASRVVQVAGRGQVVGAFLQCNFGRRAELTILGRHVGPQLADDNPLEDTDWLHPGGGSVIAVIATDAPLLPGQCAALARRVPLGLARTGTTGSHFSGDLFLAFSVANPGAFAIGFPAGDPPPDATGTLGFIQWKHLDPLYAGVVEAVEEAVLNALTANEDMTGRLGHRSPALPRDRLGPLLAGG
jgi:D-aminopeptidase